jgi:hypothetical protein
MEAVSCGESGHKTLETGNVRKRERGKTFEDVYRVFVLKGMIAGIQDMLKCVCKVKGPLKASTITSGLRASAKTTRNTSRCTKCQPSGGS